LLQLKYIAFILWVGVIALLVEVIENLF